MSGKGGKLDNAFNIGTVANLLNSRTDGLSDSERNLLKNSQWANLGDGHYQTRLSPPEDMRFRQWRIVNDVPYDASATSDYDMAGFWKALQAGDPTAATGINANDGQMHYTDFFKTPYHESFSRESKFAKPNAPAWNDLDQLIDTLGRVVFDERNRK